MPAVDATALDAERTVVVATGNAHKVSEIEAILGPIMEGYRFCALGELGDFPDPVEDGDTFLANALIKARAALQETGLKIAVADDSGLVVDALGGAPGIFSARWAGEHGDDDANNEKLLREMAGVPDPERGAHFHSTVVLVRSDGRVLTGDDEKVIRVSGGEISFEIPLAEAESAWRDTLPNLFAHAVGANSVVEAE